MPANPKPPIELRLGYKNKIHLGKVAALGCLACKIKRAPKATKLEVHHIGGASGCGRKGSDLLTIPLCNFHHQGGNRGEAVQGGRFVFADNFKSEVEFLQIVNEKIYEKSQFTEEDTRIYELINNWIEEKLN